MSCRDRRPRATAACVHARDTTPSAVCGTPQSQSRSTQRRKAPFRRTSHLSLPLPCVRHASPCLTLCSAFYRVFHPSRCSALVGSDLAESLQTSHHHCVSPGTVLGTTGCGLVG